MRNRIILCFLALFAFTLTGYTQEAKLPKYIYGKAVLGATISVDTKGRWIYVPADSTAVRYVDGELITATGDTIQIEGGSALVAGEGIQIANDSVRLWHYTYVAQITQTSTSAPTVTVIYDDFPDPIVWTRGTTGVYNGTLAGAFPTTKTALILNNNNVILENTFDFVRDSNNAVRIRSFNAGDAQDGLLNAYIRIEAYR